MSGSDTTNPIAAGFNNLLVLEQRWEPLPCNDGVVSIRSGRLLPHLSRTTRDRGLVRREALVGARLSRSRGGAHDVRHQASHLMRRALDDLGFELRHFEALQRNRSESAMDVRA